MAELKNAFNTQQLSSINTTTTTDAAGAFAFTGIFSGTYNSDAVQNNLTVVDPAHPLEDLCHLALPRRRVLPRRHR